MRRSLHVLLIGAILPGVLLPGPIAICLCAELSCPQAAACCAESVITNSCCARDAGPRPTQTKGAEFHGRQTCLGCVVLAPEKHQTPRPQVQASDLPDLAHAAPSFTPELAHAPTAPAFFVHPKSHEPPGLIRTLPLLI
jgi:hypothetical protein